MRLNVTVVVVVAVTGRAAQLTEFKQKRARPRLQLVTRRAHFGVVGENGEGVGRNKLN